MSKDEIKATIVLVAVFVFGALCGFFIGKGIYYRPIEESVTRDTVTLHDTIPEYLPAPKDSARIKWVTRWLPANPDTIDHFVEVGKMAHDTVAVEVPITSKHYGSKDYDAWVSGFEVSLDSIKVYKETQYITEVRTISKPPNKWELDIVGGINYNFNKKKYTPHVGGELLYKPNRLQLGVRGGVEYADKVEPFVGGVVKIRIF